MKRGRLDLLLIITGVLIIAMYPLPISQATEDISSTKPKLTLQAIVSQAIEYQSDDCYFQPSQEEFLLFQQFFADALVAFDTQDDQKLQSLNLTATRLNMIVHRYPQGLSDFPYDLLVIQEQPETNGGRGIYCVTRGVIDPATMPRHTVVQCPHARSDAFTGRLGLELFFNGHVSAYFSSTMRRNVPTVFEVQTANPTATPMEDMVSENGTEAFHHGPADPAHNEMSYFQAAHCSWMRNHPASLVIQFHGFKKIEDIPERQFDLILSNGQNVENQNTLFLESERLLKICLPDKKLGIFGRDTTIFGALTNVQGQYINMYTSGVFWHLEMNYEFRKTIMEKETSRIRFLNCIRQLMDSYETL